MVMGTAKGTFQYEGSLFAQQAGYTVHLGNSKGFLRCEWRCQLTRPPGQHGLTGSRWTKHQNVVSSSQRNFQSPFCCLLALEVTPKRALGCSAVPCDNSGCKM